jgi:hypothetical protein
MWFDLPSRSAKSFFKPRLRRYNGKPLELTPGKQQGSSTA